MSEIGEKERDLYVCGSGQSADGNQDGTVWWDQLFIPIYHRQNRNRGENR